MVSSLVDSVSDVSLNAKELVTNLQSKITQEKESSFVTEVLQEDQPTGMTSARVKRSYLRYLAAAIPHERILNR